MTWTTLTRRTDAPKLTWLMGALTAAGIENRLNGASFHAPILEVRDVEQAQRILGPVDNLPDDDPAFNGTSPAWWLGYLHDPVVGDLLGAVGVAANSVRTSIADDVRCVPEGEPRDQCPLASGVIEECPQDLWRICHPLVRLETFCLSMAEVLPLSSSTRVQEVAQDVLVAVQSAHGPDGLLAGFMVLANWLTQDLLRDLASLAQDTVALGGAISAELVKADDGTIVPMRSETGNWITLNEAVDRGLQPDNN